jgi:hypothetical protein
MLKSDDRAACRPHLQSSRVENPKLSSKANNLAIAQIDTVN